MYMTYHGGRCCGIKHIWGMTNEPAQILTPQAALNDSGIGWSHSQYSHPRPKEAASDRLDALVDFARCNWPEHIIEVVVADTGYTKQAQNWSDALIERGFKEVNRNINSNSTNTVVVYHLNLNDKDVAYETRLKKAGESTPTMFHLNDDGHYVKGEPLKARTRKKPAPLPEAVEITIDGFRMVMAPEGGDVATPVPAPIPT